MADSPPVLNAELLLETLAYIEEHPEEHNQAVWHCKTVMCFAGRAAILAGRQWALNSWSHVWSPYLIAVPDDPPWGRRSPALKQEIHVEYVARRLLGLTTGQATALFLPDNTLRDIRQIVTDLVEQAQEGVSQ